MVKTEFIMKKYIIALFAILTAFTTGLAQNTLTIHQKDGQKFSFGFDEKPVATFADNYLVVKTAKTEVRYEMKTLSKFTFDEGETGVKEISEASKADITLDEYSVLISGAKAETTVNLISSDGKLLKALKAGPEGSVSFSIADLPGGIYIVGSDDLSVKILKK